MLLSLDPSERRYFKDDDTPTMRVIKGTTLGLAAGIYFGTFAATCHAARGMERKVASPGLIRMMGNYGLTFAAIGGVYFGVEQLMQHYRMKRDFVNGAVGGFGAGASVLGIKGRSISTAYLAGSGLVVASNLIHANMIHAAGQTTRIDTGNDKKRPAPSE